MKRAVVIIVSITVCLLIQSIVVAAPLPAGTTLTITQGVDGSGITSPTPPGTGSKFGTGGSPGLPPLWTDISPGTDGGIILGKDQYTEPLCVGPLPCPQLDSWVWGGINGFDFTAPTPSQPLGAAANSFDRVSCLGAGCIGLTELSS